MKIAHFIFSFKFGGAEAMLVDILNLQALNHNVAVFIINEHYDLDLVNMIDKRVTVKLFNRKKGSRNIYDIYKLNKAIYNWKPDIMHFHDSHLINMIISSFHAVKILTVHDVGLPLVGIQKYDHVIAISFAVSEYLKSKNIENKSIIYNGINTIDVLVKENLVKNTNIFRIAQVSRLEHNKKGQHILLGALEYLKNKLNIDNVYVDFIGEGDSLIYLKELSTKCGISEKVNFLGLKNRAFIYSNLRNYDLLIQPSLYEGFGLTVVEAMSAKIPVLVSNNDGPIEIIQNGKYGYFFENMDKVDCALKIKEIIESPDAVSILVENAFMYSLKKFDIKHTVNNYYKLYDDLLANRLL